MLRIRYFLIRRERSFWDNLMRTSTFSEPLYNILKDTDDISDIVSCSCTATTHRASQISKGLKKIRRINRREKAVIL